MKIRIAAGYRYPSAGTESRQTTGRSKSRAIFTQYAYWSGKPIFSGGSEERVKTELEEYGRPGVLHLWGIRKALQTAAKNLRGVVLEDPVKAGEKSEILENSLNIVVPKLSVCLTPGLYAGVDYSKCRSVKVIDDPEGSVMTSHIMLKPVAITATENIVSSGRKKYPVKPRGETGEPSQKLMIKRNEVIGWANTLYDLYHPRRVWDWQRVKTGPSDPDVIPGSCGLLNPDICARPRDVFEPLPPPPGSKGPIPQRRDPPLRRIQQPHPRGTVGKGWEKGYEEALRKWMNLSPRERFAIQKYGHQEYERVLKVCIDRLMGFKMQDRKSAEKACQPR
jgi:hypothetical protein